MPKIIPKKDLTFRAYGAKGSKIVFPIKKENLKKNVSKDKEMPPKRLKARVKADEEVAIVSMLVKKYPKLLEEKLTTDTTGKAADGSKARRLKLPITSKIGRGKNADRISEILGKDVDLYNKIINMRLERKAQDRANRADGSGGPDRAKAPKKKAEPKKTAPKKAAPKKKTEPKKAAGGTRSSPLDVPKKKAGTHKMPDGSTMKDSAMPKKDRKKAVPKKNAKTVPQKIARKNLINAPGSAREELKFPSAPKKAARTGGSYLKRNVRKGAKGAYMT